MPGVDEVAQPLSRKRVNLVVISGHSVVLKKPAGCGLVTHICARTPSAAQARIVSRQSPVTVMFIEGRKKATAWVAGLLGGLLAALHAGGARLWQHLLSAVMGQAAALDCTASM